MTHFDLAAIRARTGYGSAEQECRLVADEDFDALCERIEQYAAKCDDIEQLYIETEWADGQIIDAMLENRIFEVGMMASDDLGKTPKESRRG